MLRRSILFVSALIASAAFAAPALAVEVHIRIEGARATLFGRSEPLVTPVTGTFSPPDGAPLTIATPSPLGALERASRRGEIYYRVQSTDFGPYVDRIGRKAASGSSGWVYKVNGASPPVGADGYVLKPGDRVLWYWATFGPTGGPRTLALGRVSRNCVRAYSFDDNGARRRERHVVFYRDGRRIRSETGLLCSRRHWHRVRVGKAGQIRSEVEFR